MLFNGKTAGELLRYAAIGLASNGTLYAAYLLLNFLGLDHKVAMTATYAASVACTFLLNRHWTFNHRGAISPALFRYVTLYAVGYVLNLSALTLAVDMMALPHAWVMAVLIAASAVAIFLAQKHWVFRAKAHASAASQPHQRDAHDVSHPFQ